MPFTAINRFTYRADPTPECALPEDTRTSESKKRKVEPEPEPKSGPISPTRKHILQASQSLVKHTKRGQRKDVGVIKSEKKASKKAKNTHAARAKNTVCEEVAKTTSIDGDITGRFCNQVSGSDGLSSNHAVSSAFSIADCTLDAEIERASEMSKRVLRGFAYDEQLNCEVAHVDGDHPGIKEDRKLNDAAPHSSDCIEKNLGPIPSAHKAQRAERAVDEKQATSIHAAVDDNSVPEPGLSCSEDLDFADFEDFDDAIFDEVFEAEQRSSCTSPASSLIQCITPASITTSHASNCSPLKVEKSDSPKLPALIPPKARDEPFSYSLKMKNRTRLSRTATTPSPRQHLMTETYKPVSPYPNGAPCPAFTMQDDCILHGRLSTREQANKVCFRVAELLEILQNPGISFRCHSIELYATFQEAVFTPEIHPLQRLVLGDIFFPAQPPHVSIRCSIPVDERALARMNDVFKNGTKPIFRVMIKVVSKKAVLGIPHQQLNLCKDRYIDLELENMKRVPWDDVADVREAIQKDMEYGRTELEKLDDDAAKTEPSVGKKANVQIADPMVKKTKIQHSDLIIAGENEDDFEDIDDEDLLASEVFESIDLSDLSDIEM